MRNGLVLFMICGMALVTRAGEIGYFHEPSFKLKDISLVTKKRGVYLGYERGLYDVIGFGMEFQRKKMAIKEIHTNAFCFGFNYNFKNNILGYEASYWHKQGAIGLTYGADIIMLTDFQKMNLGVAPVVGFRLTGFHLQTGYKFLTSRTNGVEANKFFIRLRFTIHKKTDRDFNWGKKK